MRIQLPALFWIFALLLSSPWSFAQTGIENPNPGPRSNQEADFLFEEGTVALNQKNYPLSIRDLSRLLDRYPTYDRAVDAQLALIEALFAQKKYADVIKRGKELLHSKANRMELNRARTLMAQTHLELKEYLETKVVSDELLKSDPTSKQKATAYALKFQSSLEEKQYEDAEAMLNALTSLLEKEPMEVFSKLLPEFKMTLLMRQCTISHLLKNKQFSGEDLDEGPQFSENELNEYFGKKNLCFKSALPATLNVKNKEVIREWCESFTYLNHELEKLRIDPFLKQKISKDLKNTFEFSKTLSPDLSKCYEPYKIPKTKKRHRKRRVHSS